MRTVACVWAAAAAAALASCAHQAVQQPVLTADKARQAYAVGRRLAAQDRGQQQRHRADMARLISVTVSRTRDTDRTISLLLTLRNRSAKTIRSLDAGLEVHDTSGRRIGLTELHLSKPIPSHGTVTFWYSLRYLRFDEDAGTMRLAAGKPKTARVDVTEIKYADGTDAGYDD